MAILIDSYSSLQDLNAAIPSRYIITMDSFDTIIFLNEQVIHSWLTIRFSKDFLPIVIFLITSQTVCCF